jgi:hypothetical protein
MWEYGRCWMCFNICKGKKNFQLISNIFTGLSVTIFSEGEIPFWKMIVWVSDDSFLRKFIVI